MPTTEVVPDFVVDRKKTVHIVDDVAPIRDSTRLLLEAHGFSALTFASGSEYLASGVVGEVECMLFDVHMPGMTGIELLNSISSRGIDTPAVVMTADGLRVAPRLAKQINRSIVYKPFDEDPG
jgi:FixJ family two-component response regulator